MSTEREESDVLIFSGSYLNPYNNEGSEVQVPKTAGMIAEWGEINRRLRHHGYQPVMVLPSNQLQQIPAGAVVLKEYASKNLQNTLDKLMTDCDRRQSMMQELISSSHRIQRDADEERDRVYRYETEIRNLQRELEEEKLKVQEMGGVRLVELQRHGEEVQQLKRTKSELVALHLQLEQEVAQKEEEITRLQQKCQHLVSAEEKRLDRQNKVAKHFWKQSTEKKNTLDQKVLDVIDNYKSRFLEMQQEITNLRNEMESQNPSHVGSYGPTESESAVGSEEAPPQYADSNASARSGDTVSTDPLKGFKGKSNRDRKADRKTNIGEKLLPTEKQYKMLIKLLENENTQLKLELESRPNHDDWKKAKKYNKQLEKLLAQNNLSPPHRQHRAGRSKVDDVPAPEPRRYTTHAEDIEFLPIDVCREHLKEVCAGLKVSDLRDIPDKIILLNMMTESYPPMEKLIQDIMDVITSKDAPTLSTEPLSQSATSHESHCEKAWQHIIPTLRLWLTQLRGLQGLQGSINQLSFNLMPWKPEAIFEQEDYRPLTVQRIQEAVEVLCQENRASPTEIQATGEEPSLEHLKSIVAHFQKLFDINTVSGVFARMNEVYLRLGEAFNAMNNIREFLALEPTCKTSDVVNAVAKLSKAKHLLKVDDLPGIMKRLDQYDEFFPTFQSMISELKRLLRVQDMDEIVTAVTALVKFPHY